MDYFIEKATFVLRAIQGGAGAYGAVMTKNRQKIEEAQDGMKNVGIGFLVVMGAEAIIRFLQ